MKIAVVVTHLLVAGIPLASAFTAVPTTAWSSRTTVGSLSSTTAPEETIVERKAPGAGSMPDWANSNKGVSPDEFLASDMSKPDLSEMWECPLTRWDSEK